VRRRRYRHFADATQLDVELSCVAINGLLTCTKVIGVGRLGSEVRVSASFKNKSLPRGSFRARTPRRGSVKIRNMVKVKVKWIYIAPSRETSKALRYGSHSAITLMPAFTS